MADPQHLQVVGKSTPMTVITVVRPGLMWLLRVILFIIRRVPFNTIKRLRFIHFAQWTVIRPSYFERSAPGQKTDVIRRYYFLFSTNFNGPWDAYIDSFSLVKRVRKGINWLWGTSAGFPFAYPIRPFKRYIRYHEYPVDAYYNAYPDATIRDIESALKIQEMAGELEREFNRAFGPAGSREISPEALSQFLRSLHEFNRSAVHHLASTRRLRTPTRKDAAGPTGLQL